MKNKREFGKLAAVRFALQFREREEKGDTHFGEDRFRFKTPRVRVTSRTDPVPGIFIART